MCGDHSHCGSNRSIQRPNLRLRLCRCYSYMIPCWYQICRCSAPHTDTGTRLSGIRSSECLCCPTSANLRTFRDTKNDQRHHFQKRYSFSARYHEKPSPNILAIPADPMHTRSGHTWSLWRNGCWRKRRSTCCLYRSMSSSTSSTNLNPRARGSIGPCSLRTRRPMLAAFLGLNARVLYPHALVLPIYVQSLRACLRGLLPMIARFGVRLCVCLNRNMMTKTKTKKKKKTVMIVVKYTLTLVLFSLSRNHCPCLDKESRE